MPCCFINLLVVAYGKNLFHANKSFICTIGGKSVLKTGGLVTQPLRAIDEVAEMKYARVF